MSWTDLHDAVGVNPNLLQTLLDSKGDLYAVDRWGYSLLDEAIIMGNSKLLQKIINIKADLKLSNGVYPLHQAIISGHSDVIQQLIFYNADITADVICEAAWISEVDTVRELLEAKANIFVKDEYDKTPLDYASERFDKEEGLRIFTLLQETIRKDVGLILLLGVTSNRKTSWHLFWHHELSEHYILPVILAFL